MRRTTGAMCAFAVFVVQAALQCSYADTGIATIQTEPATFIWMNHTRDPMSVSFNSGKCLVSYNKNPSSFTLEPGGSRTLEVSYQKRCAELTMTWDISGGGRYPFSGTLTYTQTGPTQNYPGFAVVQIVYKDGTRPVGAKFRITCGTQKALICYRRKPRNNHQVYIQGPGASIELLSNGWWGGELFGSRSWRGCMTC
jgi:hypothetical protein